MSDFVEQCRREWKRLGVPDPLAEEMATDLATDLGEAETLAQLGEAGNQPDQPRRIGRAPGQIVCRRRAEPMWLENPGLCHDLFTSRPQCATILAQARP